MNCPRAHRRGGPSRQSADPPGARDSRWSWRADQHAATLPLDLDASVMALEGGDRHHRKQGRSTARIRFDAAAPGARALSVYLKRHYRLPVWDRVRALVHPAGRYSPAAAEWAHLERARALGIRVPEVVAVGERIGPWGHLQSYLMVAELVDQAPLHEAIPALAGSPGPRRLRPAQAGARRRDGRDGRSPPLGPRVPQGPLSVPLLPARRRGRSPAGWGRLCLIDLHRLAVHRWPASGGVQGPGATSVLDRGRGRGRRPRPAPVLAALPAPDAAALPAARRPARAGEGRALRQAQPGLTARPIRLSRPPPAPDLTKDLLNHADRAQLPADRPDQGGAETYVVDLVHRLVRGGHEVAVYAESCRAGAFPAGVDVPPGRRAGAGPLAADLELRAELRGQPSRQAEAAGTRSTRAWG